MGKSLFKLQFMQLQNGKEVGRQVTSYAILVPHVTPALWCPLPSVQTPRCTLTLLFPLHVAYQWILQQSVGFLVYPITLLLSLCSWQAHPSILDRLLSPILLKLASVSVCSSQTIFSLHLPLVSFLLPTIFMDLQEYTEAFVLYKMKLFLFWHRSHRVLDGHSSTYLLALKLWEHG